ncbi:phasin family protein [Azospirillum brasilense]|uniref:phasin family protein n=1 Tax=Azospirillum brasilense TaxID=192 RepID=UPI0003A2E0B5|nr:phasin family protein [Azospirillum brasilense]
MAANFLDLFERFNPLTNGPLALSPLGKANAETYAARGTRVAGVMQDGCRRLLDGVTAGIGESTHLAGEFAKVRSPADLVAVQREWATVAQARVVNQMQTVLDVSSKIAAELGVSPVALTPAAPAPKAAPVAVPAPAPKAEAPKVEAPKAEEKKAEAPAAKAEPVKAETPKVEAAPAPAPKAEAPKAEVKADVKAAPKVEEKKADVKVEAPKAEAAKADAPKPEAPKAAPKAEEKKAAAPAAE